MPIYLYKCEKCGVYDHLLNREHEAPACPECGGPTERTFEGQTLYTKRQSFPPDTRKPGLRVQIPVPGGVLDARVNAITTVKISEEKDIN